MSQRQRSEGPIDSTGPALYPAGHVLESRNKKREPPATFPFLYSQKQKCTRNLICGWKHLATRKKQLAVFSGHGLFRTNTYRTFCGSGGYDLCRAAGYDASQLDAVRKRSEGGRSSHTRMHSFTHNPRRTQHGARTTHSPPRRAMHTRRTHDRTHVHTHALHDWQDCEQRHAAARRGTEMERRRHSLAHTRALSHEPYHASTAHPSPPIPIITSTSATPPRIYARTHARTLPTRRILHAVIPILQGKASTMDQAARKAFKKSSLLSLYIDPL